MSNLVFGKLHRSGVCRDTLDVSDSGSITDWASDSCDAWRESAEVLTDHSTGLRRCLTRTMAWSSTEPLQCLVCKELRLASHGDTTTLLQRIHSASSDLSSSGCRQSRRGSQFDSHGPHSSGRNGANQESRYARRRDTLRRTTEPCTRIRSTQEVEMDLGILKTDGAEVFNWS